MKTFRNLLGQLDPAVPRHGQLAATQAASRDAVLEDGQQLFQVVMHGFRAQPVRNHNLHLLVLRLQKGLALGREVRAEVRRMEVGFLGRRQRADEAERGELPQLLDAQFGVDRFAADALVGLHPAHDLVGGARSGGSEPVDGRCRRQQVLQLRVRFAELPRVAPAAAAADRPVAVARENAAGQAPVQELRRGQPAVDLAQRLIVVSAGVEVGQHPVGVDGHVHEVISARRSQQLRRHLLALQRDVRVQRVTGGHAHRQAQQLAHEMVLQVRQHHLEAVQVRLRSDEARDVVDHVRVVAPCQAVAQRLGRRHVDAVVFAIGELATLAGLEIHVLRGGVAERAALGHRAVAVVQQIDTDVELQKVGALGAGEALEHHFDGRAVFQAGQLRLDVGQHANLRRSAGAAAEGVEVAQDAADVLHGIHGRVDADEGVARPQRQAPNGKQCDAAQVVGRVVRLQARRQRARRSKKRARLGRVRNLAGDEDEFMHVAQLGDGGGHGAGEAAADAGHLGARRAQEVVFQLAHRPRRDARERPRWPNRPGPCRRSGGGRTRVAASARKAPPAPLRAPFRRGPPAGRCGRRPCCNPPHPATVSGRGK